MNVADELYEEKQHHSFNFSLSKTPTSFRIVVVSDLGWLLSLVDEWDGSMWGKTFHSNSMRWWEQCARLPDGCIHEFFVNRLNSFRNWPIGFDWFTMWNFLFMGHIRPTEQISLRRDKSRPLMHLQMRATCRAERTHVIASICSNGL